MNQGLRLHREGQLDRAAQCYAAILEAQPSHFDALHLLGAVRSQQGRHAEALVRIQAALKLKPASAEALSNLGAVFGQLGRWDEALASYDEALAIRPDYADTLYNRGNVLRNLQRQEEALASYDAALAIRPDNAETLYNRGNALRDLKRPVEALASYDEALAVKPDFADAFNNRGNALQDLERPAEALASFDKALAIRPDNAEILYNRGIALRDLKRPAEALASFDKALAIKPDYAEVQWNEAFLRLLIGDFERGWKKNEWRWRRPSTGLQRRDFAQPLWLGAEAINGKTILLHSEQGLGDTIQFCRYAPLVAARGARVILAVEEPLRQLMSGLDGVSLCVSKAEALPGFDLHCPMLSLPLAFATRLETIPAAIPYLRAPSNAQYWEARLGPKCLPRIGLAWSGNPHHKNDANRSVGLNALAPLFDVAATFVSLQRDVRAFDETALRERGGVFDPRPLLESFADTAALISRLDLVVAVDTSVAHLAGALGRPVWILLPFIPDWRWMLDRNDSPWYPTARLFRQTAPGEWASMVDRVRDALHDFVENRRMALDSPMSERRVL